MVVLRPPPARDPGLRVRRGLAASLTLAAIGCTPPREPARQVGAGEAGARRAAPRRDALADAPRGVPLSWPSAAADLVKAGAPVHIEDRLGVPTFLWAARPGPVPAALVRSLDPASAARMHLGAYAPLYGLDARDVAAAITSAVHDTGQGAVLVKLRQMVGGIEVFREQLIVIMNRDHELVALSGYLTGAAATAAKGGVARFSLDERRAVASALRDMTGAELAPGALGETGAPRGGYRSVAAGLDLPVAAGAVMRAPARVKPVLFHLPSGLEPGWYVEVQVGSPASTDSDAWAYVISAADGGVLFRHDLTADDSFSFRVWADATGAGIPFEGPQGRGAAPHPRGRPDGYEAPFVAPNLLTRASGPSGSLGAWLPPGAADTAGNNADVYADVTAPDGRDATDFRATLSGPGAFDRTYDTTAAPAASRDQQMAAVTQLFYNVNFFHDWFYDLGFDEAAGNGQERNFGRGGQEGDALLAEAQDAAGFNNANMRTPADGGPPRMQMYVFSGLPAPVLTIDTPAAAAGAYVGGAAIAMGPRSYRLAGDLAQSVDAEAPTGDACQPVTADFAGKIAVVDRGGGCLFADKARNVQAAGASAVIIANVATTFNPGRAPTIAAVDPSVIIPVLTLDLTDGDKVRAQLVAGARVHGTIERKPGVDRDGTLDSQIVAHEWGHFISNRLIGDGSGLSATMAGGLGEGWGDFHALLITVRPEDTMVPGNERFGGAYAMGSYAISGGAATNQAYYHGLRRVPYSTDFARNPLTFRHIANGVPLPVGPPYRDGEDGMNNAEVHNAGEIWATMLWECWAAMLGDTLPPAPRSTFESARDRMRGDLVAAYKATPVTPTLLEARDALLAVMTAGDAADFALCSKAFARRGAGIRASAPDRFSVTNGPVVESFVSGGDVAVTGTTLTDGVAPGCGPEDGSLDEGETGRLTVQVKNVGDRPLGATRATVTSTSPEISFVGPTSLSFPPLPPFGVGSGSTTVRLGKVTRILKVTFEISVDDPALALGAVTAVSSHRVNTLQMPERSAADDTESPNPVWTMGGEASLAGAGAWRRIEIDALDHRWLGPDHGAPSDQWLTSPPLQVASTGGFTFAFRHRYAFESDAVTYFDGGVIEITADGGATWRDVGASAAPGYDGMLDGNGMNPLGGRDAYSGQSAGYPDLRPVLVDLATAYAGKTVQIRFRIGTDDASGGAGWEIDDIVFSNITNRPFPLLVTDPGCNESPVATADSYVAPARGPLRVAAPGVLANDRDPEGEPLTAALDRAPARGSVAVAADGSFAYTPVRGFAGADTFTYRASDGRSSSDAVSVTITVEALPAGPDGGTDAAPAGEDPGIRPRHSGCLCATVGDGSELGAPHAGTVALGLALLGARRRSRRERG